MKKIGIIGYGSLGKQLLNMLLEQGVKETDILIFDDHCDLDGKRFFPFNSYDNFIKDTKFFVALGYSHLELKRRLLSDMEAKKFNLATFIHASAYVHSSAEIGLGAIIFPNCTIEQNVHIGTGSICYDATIVAHDSSIMESVFLAPRVTICGNVMVGACCFIGAGTTVANNISVGESARIGMSSSVQVNIPRKGQCVGNPLKRVQALNIK